MTEPCLTRVCVTCKKERSIEEFTGAHGVPVKYCILCRLRKRAVYLKNREKILQKGKIRYAENPELFKERNHQRYNKDPEKSREYSRRRRKEKKDEVIAGKREYGRSRASFSTYYSRLTILENPKEGDGGRLLVACAKCGKYFYPSNIQVSNRIRALSSPDGCENRIYCSDSCKKACEIFKIHGDPNERKLAFERDPEWAIKVKNNAGWKCERCGSKDKLEAHHEIPIKKNRRLINETENGICLCKKCHNKVHSETGCTLSDLRNMQVDGDLSI